jgi:DHA2 family multidrug resistance protein-like MFS transporter
MGLGVLALPTVLLGLDVTVLYLVMPSLAPDLNPSATQLLWIMDIYGLLIAGFLITMGTLGDRIGRRKLLMIGGAAFAVASIAAALSTSAEMLIAARAALGIAGATLMPSTLALITNMFRDPGQRSVAIGIWATMFALGMALGPLLGGVLLEHFWWGSAFLVAVPIALVLLVAGPVLLPEYRDPRAGRFDLLSVAISVLSMLLIVFAVKSVAAHGLDAVSLLCMAAGVGFAIAFVRRQGRLDNPLLDMSLFASRAFTAALGILLVGLVGIGGVMLLVTQYLQLVAGLTPFEAGIWMAPPALMMFLAALVSPLVARRVRPGTVIAVTLGISTVGYALLTQVESTDGVVATVSGFALVYLGLGAIAALGTELVIGAAPPEKSGSASAMSEMVQELGIAIGVALLGSLSTAIYRARVVDALADDELPREMARAIGESLSSARSVDGPADEILRQAEDAFTVGMNVASLVAGVAIGLLAAVAALILREIPPLTSADSGEEDPIGATGERA